MALSRAEQIKEPTIVDTPQPRRPTTFRRATHNPRVVICGIFLIIVALVSIFASLLAPHGYTTLVGQPLLQPSGTYLLGTDDFGRDVLSRLLYAGRISLGVSVASVAIATAIGVWLGLLAGYYRGIVETLVMRGVDILLCFPTIILAIAIVAVLGPSIRNLIIVIAVVYIPRFVRIVYGTVLPVREEDYILAERAIGSPGRRILLRSVLPNVMAPILVQISLSLGFAILIETGLSFLGLGAQPPTPSWGSMVSDARQSMETNPILLIAPSVMVGLTILALNTLGDGLRDVLDPRLNQRK